MFVINRVISQSRGMPRAVKKETWAAVASALGSAAGGMLGSLWQRGTNHIQWRRTQQATEQEQAYNSEEAQKQREWEAEQAKLQRDYEMLMQDRLNDWQEGMYLKYQSPEALRQQYEAAGLNPYMMDADARGIGSSQATAPLGSAPGGAAAASGIGVPGFGSNSVDFARGFSEMAEAMAKLGEAKKLGVETDRLEKTLNSYVSEAESNSEIARINADLIKEFGRVRVTKEMKQMDENINKTLKEITLLDKEADLKLEQIGEVAAHINMMYEEAEEIKSKRNLNESQRNLIDKQVEYYGAFMNAQINELRTRARKNTADAEQSHSQAVINDYIASIKHAESNVSWATLDDNIRKNMEEARNAGILGDILHEQLRKAVADNDWYAVEKISGLMKSIPGLNPSSLR